MSTEWTGAPWEYIGVHDMDEHVKFLLFCSGLDTLMYVTRMEKSAPGCSSFCVY